jgi:hypothetical protein
MATNYPLAAAGAREPDKRPRPIPKVVKEACLLMIYGDVDDEEASPIDFISAAKAVGMRPATLRRYLTRPAVIGFLRGERRAFREAVCAGNEAALQRVRDGDQHSNPMARIAAVRALENMDGADQARPGEQPVAGIVIRILNQVSPPVELPMLDVTPSEPIRHLHKVESMD